MPPPITRKQVRNENWWKNAYTFNTDIHVQYELEFGKDCIKPGTLIKIRNQRGEYKFRCLAHNIRLDVTWIDCLDTTTGNWCSFPVSKIRSVVKPKRSRAKKENNEKVSLSTK